MNGPNKQVSKILIGIWLLIAFVIIGFWISSIIPLLSLQTLDIYILIIGRLAGLLSVYAVLTQFLLMGRVTPIERVFGHDRLAHVHHKVGRYVLIFVILHFVGIVTSYSIAGKVNFLGQLFILFEQYDDVLKAFIAFLMFVLIAVTSIYFSKIKVKYELWYGVHITTYLAILLAYGHQLKFGGTLTQTALGSIWTALYIIVLSIFAYYRFLIPLLNLNKHKFFVKLVKRESSDVVTVVISGTNMKSFNWNPGQFAIFRFLDGKRFWQAHPFSISWAKNNQDLRVTIKDSGDFTHEIGNLSVGTPVLVDGPHGVFTFDKNSKRKLLFIAGGIGITPIRSMLEEVSESRTAYLFYSNRTKNPPLKKELDELANDNHVIKYFYTDLENDQGLTSHEKIGRITKDDISRVIKSDPDNWDVYICGPSQFMHALRDILLEAGVSSKQIHSEEFSLH